MKVILTLTIEKSVTKRGKEYAESTGNSLSYLVEDYLQSFSKTPRSNEKDELSPLIKSLKGCFKVTPHFNYKKQLESEL